MKLQIAVAALTPLLLWGCGVDRGRSNAVRQSIVVAEKECRDPYALGTKVTARGAIADQAAGDAFLRGGEVFLSVDVSSASSDQLVEVKWVDPSGQVLHHDARRAPQGTRYVPFSSGATARWPLGAHRAVVLIDGRSVSERSFTVM